MQNLIMSVFDSSAIRDSEFRQFSPSPPGRGRGEGLSILTFIHFKMLNQRVFTSRVLILCLASLLLACSAVRFGYQNGEFITYWWLNGYVDFDEDQTPSVTQDIADWFAWHRKTQAGEYAKLLEFHQKRLQRNVTQNELLADFDDLKKRMRLLTERALPDLAELALSLQSRQISHLEKKFDSNNEKFRQDNLDGDAEQRQRFRYKKAMKHAEYWFGEFSGEQQTLIRAASDARPLNNELVLTDRQQRQKELIALLRKIQADQPSRDATIVMLREYVDKNFFERPGLRPELKQFLDASRVSSAKLAMLIINLATPEQKAHAIKKAQQWIDDFKLLGS